MTMAHSGCRKSPAPDPSKLPSDPQPSPPPAHLNLFGRVGSIPPSIIAQFTEETGIPVEVETFASNEQMLANLLSGGGQHDLIEPGESVIEDLIRENLLLPLNHEEIPNLKNLSPKFRNFPFDPGNVFSVPFMAETVGIVINTERVKGRVESFKDAFNGDHQGRIVVLDDPREIVSWAFATLDLPVDEVSEANLEEARPLLAKWLRQVKAYDFHSPESLLLSGEADVGILRSPAAAVLLESDKRFQWALPLEGAHLIVDNLCILRSSSQVQAAQALINFLLRPDISAAISRLHPRLNPNAAARLLLTPEQLANPASFPTEEEFTRLKIFRGIGNQTLHIEELVNSLKAQ